MSIFEPSDAVKHRNGETDQLAQRLGLVRGNVIWELVCPVRYVLTRFRSCLLHFLRMVHRHCRWCTALGQHDDLERTLTRSQFLQFVVTFERDLADYHPGGYDVLGIC